MRCAAVLCCCVVLLCSCSFLSHSAPLFSSFEIPASRLVSCLLLPFVAFCCFFRGRVERKRVRALALSQQEEKAKKAAEERAKVTDWKAEIERQAAEWRAEFLQKKEDEELERVMALQQTVEYLITQTMIAHKELPERGIPPKAKSAYQLEWEKLQSEDKSTSDGTDVDDLVLPDSNRSVEDELRGISTARKDDKQPEDKAVDKPTEDKVEDEAGSVSQEASDVATSFLEGLVAGAFDIIDKNEQERQTAHEISEQLLVNKRRGETSAALNDMIAKIQGNEKNKKTDNDRKGSSVIDEKKEKTILSTVMTEMIAQLETVALMATSVLKDEENESTASSVRQDDAPETKVDESDKATDKEKEEAGAGAGKEETKEKAAATRTEAEEEQESSQFRASLPQVEVDALAGFFADQRANVLTLQSEKSRLKSAIAKYKKKFEKKHGRAPGWHDRADAVKKNYEDYQEVRVCNCHLADNVCYLTLC